MTRRFSSSPASPKTIAAFARSGFAELRVAAGEHVAILGFDQPSAEVFVNLVDRRVAAGRRRGRRARAATSAITDSADWLATVDRFGIVSERAVLLDQLTVIQNLAMPFTLDIEPPPERRAGRAAGRWRARWVCRKRQWDAPVSQLDRGGTRARPARPGDCARSGGPPARAHQRVRRA